MRLSDYHKKKAVKFNFPFHWDKYRETRNKLNSSMRTTFVIKLMIQFNLMTLDGAGL